MGGGYWSDDTYADRAALRKSTGASAFSYSDDISKGRVAAKVNDKANPKGVKFRESRDSTDHPNSLAIGVMFDVTGSMSEVPITVQKNLPKLMGLLIRKGYAEDPQILIGAIGDARSDDAPLQIGQFESGNQIEDDLAKLWLEGNGGGQGSESYELTMYWFARHTSTDCFEKRGKKGYLFIIGDEKSCPAVSKKHVSEIIGDTLESDIPTKEIVEELKQKWNVYYILPNLTSYYNDRSVLEHWRSLLGENAVRLEDPDGVSEFIASLVGANEGIDADAITDDLKEVGASAATIASVSRELVIRGGSSLPGKLPSTGKPSGLVKLS